MRQTYQLLERQKGVRLGQALCVQPPQRMHGASAGPASVPHLLALHRRVPVICGRHRAGVGGEAVEACMGNGWAQLCRSVLVSKHYGRSRADPQPAGAVRPAATLQRTLFSHCCPLMWKGHSLLTRCCTPSSCQRPRGTAAQCCAPRAAAPCRWPVRRLRQVRLVVCKNVMLLLAALLERAAM